MRMEGAGVHAAVSAIDWGVTRMLRRAAALAALLTIGASGVSLSREAPYLGNWARADGKTRIHVAHCGGEVCARNTWVRHGVSGEKVGDRLILDVKPAGAEHWSGKAFDPQRNRTYTIGVRVTHAHMTTRGCMMGGLMCQSMNWSRAHRS
ncbi:MAG TPA: DUF2147 domain-containing protein [Roseiarcus sp.]|jgi:uncharacterized protein (DUF2147 family)